MRLFNHKITLFEILLIIDLLHDIPAVGFYMPGAIFSAIVVLTFAVGLFQVKRFGSHILSPSIKIMGVFILAFFFICINHSYSPAIAFYQFLQSLIYPIIGFYLLSKSDVGLAKIIFLVLSLTYIITSITTTIGCMQYPLAARELTGNQDDSIAYALYKSKNIGDFHFVYFLTISMPLIIGLIKQGYIKRYVGYILVCLFLTTIYFSAYTTALLLSVMSVALLFVGKELNSKNTRKVVTAFVVIAIFSSSLLPVLLEMLSSFVGTDDVSSRLTDVASYMNNQDIDEDGDMSIRLETFSKSFNAFLSSPLIGSWGNPPVGGHSYYLDTMGNYGLIGIAALILMYRKVIHTVIKPFKKHSWYGYIVMTFVLSVMQAAINPNPSLKVLIVAIPIFIILMLDKDEENTFSTYSSI